MDIIGLLIGIFAFLAFGSWFYAVFEMFGTSKFLAWTYKVGVPIFRSKYNGDSFDLSSIVSDVQQTADGKYKKVSQSRLLFRSNMPLFGFHIHTPFPIRGIMNQNQDGSVEIRGLIPLGTTIFFLMWLLGWTFGGIAACFSGKLLLGLGILTLGYVFVGGLIGYSLWLEKKRFIRELVVVSNYLNWNIKDQDSFDTTSLSFEYKNSVLFIIVVSIILAVSFSTLDLIKFN